MFAIMVALIVLGVLLLGASFFVMRWGAPAGIDRIALARILQAVGIVLLVIALFVRPHQPDTAAFPPHPDAAVERER